MKLMFQIENTENFQELDIDGASTVYELKQMIQSLTNIPFNQVQIQLNGQKITNPNLTISQLNVGDNILIVSKAQPQAQSNNIGDIFTQAMSNLTRGQPQQPQHHPSSFPQGTALSRQFDLVMRNLSNLNQNQGNSASYFANLSRDIYIKDQVKIFKDKYLTSPDELNYLFHQQPELAEAVVAGDDTKIENFIRKKVDEMVKERNAREKEYQELMRADSNDPNAQKKIAEIIKNQNIEENYKYAQDYLPETLIPVHMLYINIEMNKKKITALVDTGAQSTVMSKSIAEKCDLINLCDTRFSGIAKGVGESKIIGVVHAAQMKVCDQFIMCKVTVVENNAVGMIFGLDNMRSYRCNIDLIKQALVFPDVGIQAPFLSDGEIKKLKELEEDEEEKMEIQKAKEASKKDK